MFKQLFGRQPASPIKQMSVDELAARLKAREQVQLIDVRSPEEFKHDGHVAGARLIPLPALAQRQSEIDRSRPVVLICRSGNRSQAAADMLERLGFSDLTNVQGGMMAWQRAGHPCAR